MCKEQFITVGTGPFLVAEFLSYFSHSDKNKLNIPTTVQKSTQLAIILRY